jgi:hypothetical protein
MDVQYPDVHVKLTGRDGNAMLLIGRVGAALRREVSPEAADAFARSAFDCGSYDELLQLIQRTVQVS